MSMSYAVGVDIPLSQMPPGMDVMPPAPTPGGGIGQAILGGLGRGALGAVNDFLGGSQSSSAGSSSSGGRTSYSDRTRDLLGALIAEAIDSFETPQSTI